MNLGERVLQARRARGWSRDRLAENAGVGQGTISRIESGKVVKVNSVERVGTALGLPLNVLFDESGGAISGLPGWELLTDAERDYVRGLVAAIADGRRPALRRAQPRRQPQPASMAEFDRVRESLLAAGVPRSVIARAEPEARRFLQELIAERDREAAPQDGAASSE